MNIQEALKYGYDQLKSFDSYKVDASSLLKYSTTFSDLDLLINQDSSLTEQQIKTYQNCIKDRLLNKPVAYIIGTKEFYSLEFKVNEHTLIPRPDTEILVDKVLEYINANRLTNPKILDLGTGSGAIILSILSNIENGQGFAVDLNPNAITMAKQNAVNLKISDKVNFIESSWFNNVNTDQFDIIVANPPYISDKSMLTLDDQVKDFEPTLALNGGPLGYEPYREIISNAPTFFKNQGCLFLEIGFDQKNDVLDLFDNNIWHDKKCFKDFGNNDRLIISKLNKKG